VGTAITVQQKLTRHSDIRTTLNVLADLDYLIDPKANTIGALMLHLAATETYHQLNTFEGRKWDSWPDSVKQQWDAAMNLGDAGRKTIKGHNRDYYLNILQETRAKPLTEFSKRDDAWLMAVDKVWPWGPTNNYCKWFHVSAHEAHHTGQIAFLRKRLPGAKPDSDRFLKVVDSLRSWNLGPPSAVSGRQTWEGRGGPISAKTSCCITIRQKLPAASRTLEGLEPNARDGVLPSRLFGNTEIVDPARSKTSRPVSSHSTRHRG
jgi:hypothetical protein